MLNKKLGVSISWLTRSNSVNIFLQEDLRQLVKNIFLKQNIFISDVLIQEYPTYINIICLGFFLKKSQYKLLKVLLDIISLICLIKTKKNIYISFSISKNIYHNIEILSDWLLLKFYNQPSNIKKLLKLLLKEYDTITK